MQRMMGTLVVLLGLAWLAPAQGAVLTEGFDDPLAGWTSRWFGTQSNATNFIPSDPGYRGNNVTGLSVDDGDINDGGMITVVFNSAFAATITNFALDVLSYNQQTLTIVDKDGAALLSIALTPVSGPPFDFADASYTRYSVASTNGIGGFNFRPFGAAGNVSIDDLAVTTAVPEPASLALLLLGIGGLGLARRRSGPTRA